MGENTNHVKTRNEVDLDADEEFSSVHGVFNF